MSAAQLEAEKKDFESQLDLVIQSLKDDPDNTELVALKTELEGMIQFINESIAELKPKAESSAVAAPPPPQAAAAAEEQPPKWSRENHPAFKKSSSSNAASVPPPPSAEEQQDASSTSSLPVNYQVNDTVMAKWMSGDKGFYPARITSVTGSKTAPIYTVKFKSYDTVETLRAKDIRPMASSAATAAAAAPAAQKRKADSITSGAVSAGAGFGAGGAGAPPPLPPPSSFSSSNANKNNNGIVLSATPELYPVQQSKAEDDEKPKPKFKKIKANKELEAGKNKWQEFTQKGKIGGKAKKESMFRTPEGVKGRVGFTGSGQGMRKDPTRSRHVYQPNEDLD